MGSPQPIGRTFWDRLDRDERRYLTERSTKVEYSRDQNLVVEGDCNTDMLVLHGGAVKVVVNLATGREVILAVRRKGDLVGELAALSGDVRSATVRAISPVTAIRFSGTTLLAAVTSEPGVVFTAMRTLTERLRESDRFRGEIGTAGSLQRIAIVLLDLYLAGADGDSRPVVLSQLDLAALAATSRSSVVRALTVLRNHGVVETRRRRIIVADIDVLTQLAAGHLDLT